MPNVYLVGVMMLVILVFNFAFYACVLYFVAGRLLTALNRPTDELSKRLSAGNSLKMSLYLSFLPFMVYFIFGFIIGFLYVQFTSFFGPTPMSGNIVADLMGLAIFNITLVIPLIQLVYTKKQLDLSWVPSLLVFALLWIVPFLVDLALIGMTGALPMYLM